MDIVAVDKPFAKNRFIVIYRLNSINFNYNILLNILLMQNESLPSALNLYSSAGWLEREVWDFFGIYFYNHNDLRRILTDYGFVGFPLRKDFPLSGYLEVSYVDEKKRVVLEPLNITQEFRFFNFRSSWE
jgi:NADH:ubiquinone oxidoreductase subunit C